ncbi:MAG: HPF/RaiA family ribosome-associated protein [Steroidobacteraceae bacterium]
MQIQINTDHNIQGREALAERVRGIVSSALDRFSTHITRVEVHLGDENAKKGGQHDKRCMIEVRLEGRQPMAVTDHAETLGQAIGNATDKMTHLIESTLGRLHDHRNHMADLAPPEVNLPEE